jgi:endo-1,4-beta-xylanase
MSRALLAFVACGVAAAAESEPIPLWHWGAPGSEEKAAPEVLIDRKDGIRRIAGIHNPSITPHLPSRETATGAAVIILPGGGHRYLSIDNEGHAAARWLAERGIAAFVLKYRLAREEGSTYTVEGHAVQDTQRAMRLVRSRAKDFSIDPNRTGLLGFSAGGQLVMHAVLRAGPGIPEASDPVERESSRPAFQVLIYSGGGPVDAVVPKDTPPAFIVVAFDDRTPTANALAWFQSLRAADINAELHVYSKGGHGFGMRQRPLAITSWPQRFREWLIDQGFLGVGRLQYTDISEP